MPRVADWLDGVLRDLRSRIAAPSGTTDPRFSPHLVAGFSTPEFVGPDARRDGQIRYVGPSNVDRPAGSDFPWDWLDDSRSRVLVTLVAADTDVGARFLAGAWPPCANGTTGCRR
ncbi:hypothetical protein ABZ504_51030 [Streptomyces mirabilis]|uniref:hypothetical protein n=1 Tax=Streptomyces mirabilis TaxID=68239 RepID=UPI0033FB8F95